MLGRPRRGGTRGGCVGRTVSEVMGKRRDRRFVSRGHHKQFRARLVKEVKVTIVAGHHHQEDSACTRPTTCTTDQCAASRVGQPTQEAYREENAWKPHVACAHARSSIRPPRCCSLGTGEAAMVVGAVRHITHNHSHNQTATAKQPQPVTGTVTQPHSNHAP